MLAAWTDTAGQCSLPGGVAPVPGSKGVLLCSGGCMGVLCDSQIRELIGIEPFEENTKRGGKISYGVSSYGYDLRVGSVFKIFTNVNSEIVDPKKFSERSFVTIDCDETRSDHVLIPPNSFALCETIERVTMPREYL